MSDFVDRYNNDHQHSGITFVTPQQAHSGERIEPLALRREAVGGSDAKLNQDFCIKGKCRDWDPVSEVSIIQFLRISRLEMGQKGAKGR
jgi:hypothetical protein